MRLLIVLAALLSATQAQTKYFPLNSMDRQGSEFKNEWYSYQLSALQEPSLIPSPKVVESETYRFLWLRSFHHPVAIRLNVKLNGTGVLTTKIADGAGGFRPGVLTLNSTQVLSKDQVQSFIRKVDELSFWTAPNPVEDQQGTDGSQWIVEGVKAGKYHVVDRWSPNKGVVRELGLMLILEFAKMNIPKNDLY